jgi:hypothetical protein
MTTPPLSCDCAVSTRSSMTYSTQERSSTQTRPVDLALLAQRWSQLFDTYHCQNPGEIKEARLDAFESL